MLPLLCGPIVLAGPVLTAEEQEAWLDDDSELRALAVNEGRLVFLKPPADHTTLYSENELTIGENSPDSGWVELKQCHYQLDPVNKVDIVYTYIQMKNLRVDSYEKIGRVDVIDQSVRLENVSHGASLCVRANVRVFYNNFDGSYTLRNGPYYRKFLDGYYPYHVTMTVTYPGDLLLFRGISPEVQEGFKIIQNPNQVKVDAWFDGALRTEMIFELKP